MTKGLIAVLAIIHITEKAPVLPEGNQDRC